MSDVSVPDAQEASFSPMPEDVPVDEIVEFVSRTLLVMGTSLTRRRVRSHAVEGCELDSYDNSLIPRGEVVEGFRVRVCVELDDPCSVIRLRMEELKMVRVDPFSLEHREMVDHLNGVLDEETSWRHLPLSGFHREHPWLLVELVSFTYTAHNTIECLSEALETASKTGSGNGSSGEQLNSEAHEVPSSSREGRRGEGTSPLTSPEALAELLLTLVEAGGRPWPKESPHRVYFEPEQLLVASGGGGRYDLGVLVGWFFDDTGSRVGLSFPWGKSSKDRKRFYVFFDLNSRVWVKRGLDEPLFFDATERTVIALTGAGW